MDTPYLIILYKKFIKIALYPEIPGMRRHNIIRNSPEYINNVTKGEITVVATIPIGEKDPNNLSEIGIVNIWAEVEAEREFARKYGRNRIYKILNSLLNIKIPANAL